MRGILSAVVIATVLVAGCTAPAGSTSSARSATDAKSEASGDPARPTRAQSGGASDPAEPVDPDAGEALPRIPRGVDTIDDYIAYLADDRFSGVLRVEHDGVVVAREALGLADREAGTPNTVDTAFDVGSIAKTFTSMTVLMLVDDGELALDDTLGDLLTEVDVPADKRDITVLQLLEHTAGLREYHDSAGDFEVMSRDKALAAILDQKLRFTPGTDQAYSNSGYTLAAILVEEVTGRGFTEVVGDVFAEAGLDHTGFYSSPALRDIPVATGYEDLTHGDNNPALWELTWALVGNAGIAMTVDDLARWWDLLLSTALLQPETAQVLRESEGILWSVVVGATQWCEEPGQTDACQPGAVYRWHDGANDFGFNAVAAGTVQPGDDQTSFVVMTNATDPDYKIALVATQLVTAGDTR